MNYFYLIGFNSAHTGVYEPCAYQLNEERQLNAVSEIPLVPLPPKIYQRTKPQFPPGCEARYGDYAAAYRDKSYRIALILLTGKCAEGCPILQTCPIVAREGLFYDGFRFAQKSLLPQMIIR
jgi:hypothetical protein